MEESWLERNVKWRIDSWYKHYILELVFRQRPLPPSKDGRHIRLDPRHSRTFIDERRGGPYLSNSIRSSRYTLWDFLPRQILFQCTRLSNFYFICIGVPQTIPGISPTGSFTTILPVLFFLSLTILKEGYDDYRRYRLDKVENKNVATVLRESGDNHWAGAKRTLWGIRSVLSRFGAKKPSVEDVEATADWKNIQWRDIRVGDVVRLQRDETIPTDIVLLSASGANGIAYVETTALDGETNLKSKQALSAFKGCDSISGIQSCHAEFVIEDPNPNLYEFEGRVSVGDKIFPLGLNEVIYRGSVLRNTASAIGLVVNSGEECKIRMNANHHPRAKKPRLEKYANQVVLFLVAYVVTLAVGCSMGYLLWQASTEYRSWYLKHAAVNFRDIIVGFLIEFNNVIPLALYISLEIVKLGQMLLLQCDIEMYDEDSDTPMRCNTNTILENLGQVNFLLSDKTGTLTENVMKFRKMSIAGTIFEHEPTKTGDARSTISKNHQQGYGSLIRAQESQEKSAGSDSTRRQLHGGHAQGNLTTADLVQYAHSNLTKTLSEESLNFVLGMALCNTCVPEVQDGPVTYQGSSSDEVALIQAAQELGYEITQRTSDSMMLRIENQDNEVYEGEYEILDVIEFSSKRKRMSTIVRCPDDRIWLICKGADSTIMPRLRQASVAAQTANEVRKSLEIERQIRRSEHCEFRPSMARRTTDLDSINRFMVDTASTFNACFRHIDEFATDGLRTLVFAHKYIDQNDYYEWKKLYQEAITSFSNRQKSIEKTAELIEQSLDLLGASAIEDKLQKGVPETVDKLRRANIKIWMLTGDKRETAINVAHAARICQPDSDIFVLDSKNGDIAGQLHAVAEEMAVDQGHTVVVIDGHTLADVEEDMELKTAFYALIPSVPSVICCRASPAQKATIVKAIKTQISGALTLAIGDGANDVAMIQTSQVGIGISGREGLQASRVADFSIAQFRFLQRLLLVHGRWNYTRTAKFILLTFWKEMFFYMPQALYQRYNGYTGTSLYENWSLTVLNTFFTSLCIVIMGIFEQDVSAGVLLEWPELYVYGQKNGGLNLRKHLGWMLCAAAEGMVVWFVSWAAYGQGDQSGDEGLFAVGDLVFSVAIIWTNWKLFFLQTQYKTVIVFGSFAITFGGWWAWNAFLSGVYTPFPGQYAARNGLTKSFGRDPIWWLTIILIVTGLAMIELTFNTVVAVLGFDASMVKASFDGCHPVSSVCMRDTSDGSAIVKDGIEIEAKEADIA